MTKAKHSSLSRKPLPSLSYWPQTASTVFAISSSCCGISPSRTGLGYYNKNKDWSGVKVSASHSTYLWVYSNLDRVVLDRRWLHGEVRDIFVLLSIAHVNLAPLSLPEVGHGTGPDHRFDDDAHVLLRAVQRIAHRVGHLITVAAQNPRRVVTLASLVTRDRLKSGLIGVRLQ